MRVPIWITRMPARDSTESHRASTPLELFFDLCFVVGIAQAASSLHHAFDEQHFREALVGYPMVFFAIWWAWMTFTWFASAYDNDDVPYRLGVFVQIAGVLILAAGVPRAFTDGAFGVIVVGYVVMRIGLISLWLRAAMSDPPRRRTNLRHATGLGVVQIGWILMLWAPSGWVVPIFACLAVIEMAVPVVAQRYAASPWHPEHIAERYGLFAIIVLGETILAATFAVQSALDGDAEVARVLMIAAAALLIVCSMWWIYFAQPAGQLVEDARHAAEDARHAAEELPSRGAFIWGYGHYFVYSAAAAVGAGIAVAVDQATQHAEISERLAILAIAAPVALYVTSVWVLHRRARDPGLVLWAYPGTAVLILAVGLAGLPVPLIGVLMVALVVVGELGGRAADPTAAAD